MSERAEPAADELATGLKDAAKEVGDSAVPIAKDGTKEISAAAKQVKEEAPSRAEKLSKTVEDQAEEIARQAKPTADKAASQVHVRSSHPSRPHGTKQLVVCTDLMRTHEVNLIFLEGRIGCTTCQWRQTARWCCNQLYSLGCQLLPLPWDNSHPALGLSVRGASESLLITKMC